MIRKEGGADHLNPEEVRVALKTRGFQNYTLSQASTESLRKMLDRWIHYSLSVDERHHSLRLIAIILRAR